MSPALPLARPLLWLSRALFLLLAGMGTATAILPGNGGVHVFPWDKAEHFACFYALTAVGAFAFPRLKAWWLALGLILLGGLIEIVQGLPMVARDSDWRDWVADMAAIAAALGPMIIAAWREKWRAARS